VRWKEQTEEAFSGIEVRFTELVEIISEFTSARTQSNGQNSTHTSAKPKNKTSITDVLRLQEGLSVQMRDLKKKLADLESSCESKLEEQQKKVNRCVRDQGRHQELLELQTKESLAAISSAASNRLSELEQEIHEELRTVRADIIATVDFRENYVEMEAKVEHLQNEAATMRELCMAWEGMMHQMPDIADNMAENSTIRQRVDHCERNQEDLWQRISSLQTELQESWQKWTANDATSTINILMDELQDKFVTMPTLKLILAELVTT
jgi:hypothetical protein